MRCRCGATFVASFGRFHQCAPFRTVLRVELARELGEAGELQALEADIARFEIAADGGDGVIVSLAELEAAATEEAREALLEVLRARARAPSELGSKSELSRRTAE